MFGCVSDGVADDVADVVIGQGVAVLFARPCRRHEACCSKHLEVLGHGGLRNAEYVHELVDTSIPVGEFCNDLQPPRMCQCLQQRSSVTVGGVTDVVLRVRRNHTRNILFEYLNINPVERESAGYTRPGYGSHN